MNIYEKLSNIQAELKAPKSQYNEFGKYNYRNCEDILEAVKPICKKYKTTLILDDEIVLIGARYYVKATAMLIDTETESEEGKMTMTTAYAREEESKKGMDGSQVTGASSSYARKYALNGLFNIDDTKDSDTTNKGETGKQEAKTARQGERHEQPPAQNRTPQHTGAQNGSGMTLDEALNYSMTKGKHGGIKFCDVPLDYLKWCAENLTGKAAEAAKLVVDSVYKNDQKSEQHKQLELHEIEDDDDCPF